MHSKHIVALNLVKFSFQSDHYIFVCHGFNLIIEELNVEFGK